MEQQSSELEIVSLYHVMGISMTVPILTGSSVTTVEQM